MFETLTGLIYQQIAKLYTITSEEKLYYTFSVRVYINKLDPLIEIPIFCTSHQTLNCGSKGLTNTDCND
jgi:hypothetical protein